MLGWWISIIFSLLWLSLHFLYHILTYTVEEVRWYFKYACNRLLSCSPSYSEHGQLMNIFNSVKQLKTKNKKTPKHLGVVVFGKESLRPFESLWTNLKGIVFPKNNGDSETNSAPDEDRVDFQALAKVVCYAWVADIPVVSLYDHNGHVKANYKEFLNQVQIEISQNRWIVGERTRVPPMVKLRNVPQLQKQENGYANGHTNGYTNGMNGFHPPKDQPEVLNICLFSYEDGKDVIIKTCKELCREMLHSKEGKDGTCINEFDERVVDKKINAAVGLQFASEKEEFKTDPDLMMVLGKFASTTGFLPWQIRLTEIHWVPSLKRFNENDFLQSMLKYANCNQRFGT